MEPLTEFDSQKRCLVVELVSGMVPQKSYLLSKRLYALSFSVLTVLKRASQSLKRGNRQPLGQMP